ncbi:MAG: FtsX-like permease family protein, partial [Vallitaleaceae bacterium]|nr:FtsX-like permease family protein [Vallitaleaceae bacterium]
TILVIFVGGLGFVTTMNINVIERTREIGILRALGMKDKYLRRMIVLEGIIIAIISWVVSIGIAIPLSRYLGSRFFDIFFEAKIQHSISLFGMFLWLDVVVFFSVIASLISVRNAMKLSVRESLSYE